ncbi:MAG: Hsp20/alpha crystallin family protein [Candidatus Sedimenticola sp. (ex Thyasira tokunagai)]
MKLKIALFAALPLLLTTAPLVAAPPWSQGYMGSGSSHNFQRHSGSHIQIRNYNVPGGYQVQITVSGRSPDSIRISVQPGQLILQESRSNEERHHNQGSRGYFHSWSSMSQRIPLPRDADIEGMTRQNSEGTITLTIPRRQYRRW